MKIIETKKAPAAVGPYSQAINVNGLVYTSGMLPIDPETGKIEAACIEVQTDQAIKNLSAVLEELRAERGTHYAPYLVDLFDDPAVFEGVERLITEGRDENYRKTYHLLKSL